MTILVVKNLKKSCKFNIWRNPRHLFTAPLLGTTDLETYEVITFHFFNVSLTNVQSQKNVKLWTQEKKN